MKPLPEDAISNLLSPITFNAKTRMLKYELVTGQFKVVRGPDKGGRYVYETATQGLIMLPLKLFTE